jgi:PAS domain S-box-containing protein
LDECVSPFIFKLFLANAHRCLQSNTTQDYSFESNLTAPTHYYSTSLIPVDGDCDGGKRIVAIVRDITKMKEAETTLKTSECAFRTLAENAPDAIVRYDKNLHRVYVNPEFVRLSGVAIDKLVGDNPYNVFGASDEVVRYVHGKLREVIELGSAVKFEVNWSGGGAYRCWFAHAVPEYDASGSVKTVLTIWRDISERKQAEERLSRSYDLLRELTSRRETAREEERKRLAREIHDELGQHLTALRLGISSLPLRVRSGGAKFPDAVKSLVSLADATVQVLRDVVTALRPSVLDAGVSAALEWLVAEHSKQRQIVFSLQVPEECPEMSEDQEIAIFRVAQEALTNVTRHANAHRVHLELTRNQLEWAFSVSDDGKGFDQAIVPPNSFGLLGMKERAAMLGGILSIVSSLSKGTAIIMRIPL